MIKVIIELWPLGLESRKQRIGEINIANDGTGDRTTGNYNFWLAKRGQKIGLKKSWWKSGSVKGFPRKRLGPYDLLYRCLREVVAHRNVEKPAKGALF